MNSCATRSIENRSAIVDVCRRLHERGYVAATSGNVSVRAGKGFLITPTSMRKDMLNPEIIVMCNASGISVNSEAKPSSELRVHKLIYEQRADVGAIIHAHPRFCLACSLLNVSLAELFLVDQATSLGPTVTVPFAVPGTDEVGNALSDHLHRYNSFILERHGVIVVGENLQCAYNRLEQLEHVASVAYLASAAGNIESFCQEDLERLKDCLCGQ